MYESGLHSIGRAQIVCSERELTSHRAVQYYLGKPTESYVFFITFDSSLKDSTICDEMLCAVNENCNTS